MENKSETISVIDQMKAVMTCKGAGLWGAVKFGAIPASAYYVAHVILPTNGALIFKIITAACLIFSGFTVYTAHMRTVAGSKAYCVLKSLAFAVILEGIMTFVNGWPSYLMLGILVALNAIEGAYQMVMLSADRKAIEQAEIDEAVAVAVAAVHAQYAAEKEARKAKRQAKVKTETETVAKPAKRRRNTAQRKAAETGKPVAVAIETNALVIPTGAEALVAEAIEAAA
ncbi:MAG TPA: hypothetical protein PLP33_29535 [Leptospiraceae bacterium]|nr:hypothetical protein [Leptospiraceae bacterium]